MKCTPGWFSKFLSILLLTALSLLSGQTRAADLGKSLKALTSGERTDVESAVATLSSEHSAEALAVLEALESGSLRVDSNGAAYAARTGNDLTPIAGAPAKPTPPLKTPLVDNRMRRILGPTLGALRLGSTDRAIRLRAAEDLKQHRDDELAEVVRKALARESDKQIRTALGLALAQTDLAGSDAKRKLAAISVIQDSADPKFKPDLERLLLKDDKGQFHEPNAEVRSQAQGAISSIESRATVYAIIGHLFYGLSLASVLLLAALGLAITFGLMRVINMAHGELLMIGAYATYTVQKLFETYAPGHLDWYIVCAVPVAFVVSGLVGMLLEVAVLRRLYGRPLETLLATWGISLLLIQTVRLIFGAQNVTVANPSWLSGGVELLPGFVLTYSRVSVILFSGLVITFVWMMLQKSSLGLDVRAVTQNREMAANMGISTRRVDAWTFGIGSGVAGLGGVALSQLGNVGPELGQTYIVDSFMVVILGGVGNLLGTLAGALGLGVLNKLLEPTAGAVLGKIVILVIVIMFIQRRPQGIFALKGRAAEVT